MSDKSLAEKLHDQVNVIASLYPEIKFITVSGKRPACGEDWQHKDLGIDVVHDLIDGKVKIKSDYESGKPIPGTSKLVRHSEGQRQNQYKCWFGDYKTNEVTGIGIRTGECSDGLVDVDLDGEKAIKLAESNGLPLTVSWTSGKDGRRHHLYRIPRELWDSVKNTKGVKLGDGDAIEFLWNGSQFVAPPSLYPDGYKTSSKWGKNKETGKFEWITTENPKYVEGLDFYRWINDIADTPIAIAPDWVIEMMRKPSTDEDSRTPLLEVSSTNGNTPPSKPNATKNHSSSASDISVDDYHKVLESIKCFDDRMPGSSQYPDLTGAIWGAVSVLGADIAYSLLKFQCPSDTSKNWNLEKLIFDDYSPSKAKHGIGTVIRYGAIQRAKMKGTVIEDKPKLTPDQAKEKYESLLKYQVKDEDGKVLPPAEYDHEKQILDFIAEIDNVILQNRYIEKVNRDFALNKGYVNKVVKTFQQSREDDEADPRPQDIGLELATINQGKLWFSESHQSFMKYEAKETGVFSLVSDNTILADIQKYCLVQKVNPDNHYRQNVLGTLKAELFIQKWDEVNSLENIPFLDGVLHIATGKLNPHSPNNFLTWVLPRNYACISPEYPAIDKWLNELTQGKKKDRAILEAFLAATLRGMSNLQKFLMLTGVGGNGKGVYLDFATELVGRNNTWEGSMADLERPDRLVELQGKRLAKLDDQSKHYGDMQIFKKLTGHSDLTGAMKFKDSVTFKPTCITMVTANGAIAGGFTGRWYERRVVLLQTDFKPVVANHEFISTLTRELPAFTQYLLKLSPEKIKAIIYGLDGDGQKNNIVSAAYLRDRISADSLTNWLNECLIADSSAESQLSLTSNKFSPDRVSLSLYGSYCEFLEASGIKNGKLARESFSTNLVQLLQSLNIPFTPDKNRLGRVFRGVRVRTELDFETHPTFLEKLEDLESKTNGDGCVTADVTACDTPVTVAVTPLEPLIYKGSDGCDGLSPINGVGEKNNKELPEKETDTYCSFTNSYNNPPTTVTTVTTAHSKNSEPSPQPSHNRHQPSPQPSHNRHQLKVDDLGGLVDSQEKQKTPDGKFFIADQKQLTRYARVHLRFPELDNDCRTAFVVNNSTSGLTVMFEKTGFVLPVSNDQLDQVCEPIVKVGIPIGEKTKRAIDNYLATQLQTA